MTETKRRELTRLKEELVFTILKYKEIFNGLPDGELELVSEEGQEKQYKLKCEKDGKIVCRTLFERTDEILIEIMLFKKQLDEDDMLCRYNLCDIVDFLEGETEKLELIVMTTEGQQKVDVTEGEMMKYFLPMLKTKGGEYVCTISEALIANYLFDMGIPYKYKELLVMEDGEERYPTFELYNPYLDEKCYFEYFEMMENTERIAEFCRVQELYMANGFETGKNFIYGMESQSAPFNMEMVDTLVRNSVIAGAVGSVSTILR